MTFNHFNRRLHVYLALALIPWVLMYGISSLFIQHRAWLRTEGPIPWTTRFERPYHLEIAENADLRQVGAQIMRETDLDGGFHINRRNNTINLTVFDFWQRVRLTYDLEQHTLLAEDQEFRWDYFIILMHIRGGFAQETFLNDLWAVVVDIVCIGFVLWIASGLYMWWHLKQTRRWGFVALGAGLLTFAIFLGTL